MGFLLKNISRLLKLVGALLTLLLAGVYVASAYGGTIDPLESSKPAVLHLAYPFLLAAIAVTLVAWLVLRQWKIAVIPLIALVATGGQVLTHCPLNVFAPSVPEGATEFTLLSFNVSNFDDYDGTVHQRNRTVQYILDVDADVVCLQEGTQRQKLADIEVIKDDLPDLLARYPYYTKGITDMVMLSKYPFEETEESVSDRFRRKVVSCELHIAGQSIKIFNCHLHSIGLTMEDKENYRQLTDVDNIEESRLKELRSGALSKLAQAYKARSEQARELRQLIDQAGENVMVIGDFNDTPGSYCYRTIRGDDMCDAYADCAFGPTYTFHDNRLYFKIDHILYRGRLKAISVKRGDIDSSDHYPLVATFAIKQ